MRRDDRGDGPQLSLIPNAAPMQRPRQNKFHRLYEESLEVEKEDAVQAGQVGYINRVMVQATLPYREPRDLKEMTYRRRAGDYTLAIQRGVIIERTVERTANGRVIEKDVERLLGFPYGAKPRLLLAWLGREVKLKQDPRIVLGPSLTAFMQELGFNSPTGGKSGSMSLMKEQMLRLFSAQISLSRGSMEGAHWENKNMRITEDQELWWTTDGKDGRQLSFQSSIELSTRFYEELRDHSVPVDLRILRTLKTAPLELDFYSWLTYRYFTLTKRTVVPWEALQSQFGTEIQNPRHFKQRALAALKNVAVLYSQAKFEESKAGLVLLPSPTSVLPRSAVG